MPDDALAWDVLHNITDALVVVDAEWRYRFINRRTERFLDPGVRAADLVGQTLWDVNPELVGTRREGLLRHAMIAREAVEYDERDPLTGAWFHVTATPTGTGLTILFHDITASRRAADDLRRSESRLRAILRGVPDILFRVDLAGNVLDHYAPEPTTLALPPERFVGRSLADVLPASLASSTMDAIQRAVATGECELLEYSIETLLGEGDYEARFLATSPDEVVIIIRDVTERQRAEAERRVAHERLEEIERLREVDRFKTRVLRATSHELNTPLTPLKLQIHLLKSGTLGELNGRQYKAVEVLGRNLGRLEFLVRDMLDVARLDSGRLLVRKTRVELDETVREALEGFTEPARQANLELDVRLAYGRYIQADRQRLMQVLFNLLGNALKFTPDGGTIRVHTSGEDGWVRIVVEDTGAGIAPEDQVKLFRPFSQVHDTMEQTRSGVGLGLYICKGICDAHGGRISCESEGLGKGTTFVIELPIEDPNEAAKAEGLEGNSPS